MRPALPRNVCLSVFQPMPYKFYQGPGTRSRRCKIVAAMPTRLGLAEPRKAQSTIDPDLQKRIEILLGMIPSTQSRGAAKLVADGVTKIRATYLFIIQALRWGRDNRIL